MELASSHWVLVVSLRTKLYCHLFNDTEESNQLILQTIIRGKIELIRTLQRFMLTFINGIKSEPLPERLPNLGCLVEDAVVLLKILREPLPHGTLQSDEHHPFTHFHQQRYPEWKRFGFPVVELKRLWGHYQCNLCDALIDMWYHHKQTSCLHQPDETPNVYELPLSDDSSSDDDSSSAEDSHSVDEPPFRDEIPCVASILGSFDLRPRHSSNVPELDNNVFDASFIVSHGPFRFKKTKYLYEHLSVKGNDIFVFTDLQKLAGIRHHTVLEDQSSICRFDMLTSEGRYTTDHVISIRPFISRLHYSVQASLFLLFFQKPVHHHVLTSGAKNFRIAKELGIAFERKDIEVLAKTILGNHSTWASFLDRTTEVRLQDPLMIPLDKLYNTLTSWRPRTFWEMRYPGYGNVDMVQLYGFYFGLMVGIVAIVALTLTAAQTYAAFKALH